MSYQAVIRKSDNTLLTNQSVGVRVSILKESGTGPIVYSEIYNPNPSTNSNGLLSLEVGSGLAVQGSFAGIDWADGPYFILTDTDPDGGTNYTISGSSPLNSVPYALFSAYSGNLSGWALSGNSNIDPVTQFIGTTDDQNVVFKRNNIVSGMLGDFNTSLGYNSLNLTSTGIYNTSIGVEALVGNSSGAFNTAVGHRSLFENMTGYSNTAIGVNALHKNQAGQENTAIGLNALYSNTTGYENTATGVSALANNSFGRSNSSYGFESLFQTTQDLLIQPLG